MLIKSSPTGVSDGAGSSSDAKAAACGPVLAGATAAAQRTVKGEQRKDVGAGTSKDENSEKKHKKFLGVF